MQKRSNGRGFPPDLIIGTTDRLVQGIQQAGRPNSRITFEDYAIALVDELENPQHRKDRFTIGY